MMTRGATSDARLCYTPDAGDIARLAMRVSAWCGSAACFSFKFGALRFSEARSSEEELPRCL
jgi:hypothetical protein